MITSSSSEASTAMTVEEFIANGSNTVLSYDKLSFKEKFDDIIYPMKNILDDYIKELKEKAVIVTLSDKEFIRYKWRPKVLAHDLYGNGELDFVILALNNICDIKDFNKKEIKLLRIDELDEFMTSIYNAEKENIDIYNSNIYDDQITNY